MFYLFCPLRKQNALFSAWRVSADTPMEQKRLQSPKTPSGLSLVVSTIRLLESFQMYFFSCLFLIIIIIFRSTCGRSKRYSINTPPFKIPILKKMKANQAAAMTRMPVPNVRRRKVKYLNFLLFLIYKIKKCVPLNFQNPNRSKPETRSTMGYQVVRPVTPLLPVAAIVVKIWFIDWNLENFRYFAINYAIYYYLFVKI